MHGQAVRCGEEHVAGGIETRLSGRR